MGTIAMGPIMQLTVNYLGFSNAARVLGGTLSICTIGALLYRIPSQTGKEVEKMEETVKPRKPPMFDFSVFKNKAFLVWCISLSAFMMGYFVPFVHLVSDTFIQSGNKQPRSQGLSSSRPQEREEEEERPWERG